MSAVRRSGAPVRDSTEHGFTVFVEQHERSLREALTAAFGLDVGRDATADALAHAWQRWDRVSTMDNPAGYLYVVGRNRARRFLKRRRAVLVRYPTPAGDTVPMFEPALAGALAHLSERERAVVLLLHGFQWTMTEIAETLDISKSSVQSYAERALVKLRSGMGVER
jgi:DNA-directed RNA polymerase specialized sigma24 family protein